MDATNNGATPGSNEPTARPGGGWARKPDGKPKWRGRRWTPEERARNEALLGRAMSTTPLVPSAPSPTSLAPATTVVKVELDPTTATPFTRTGLQLVCGESRGRLRRRPDSEFEFAYNDLMGKRHRHELGKDKGGGARRPRRSWSRASARAWASRTRSKGTSSSLSSSTSRRSELTSARV